MPALPLHRRVFLALRSLVRQNAVERELDDELAFHFEQMEAHEVARGSAPHDARLRARRGFGGFDQVKEACRDMRPLRWVEHFLQDLRFGGRLLARGPGFSAVAILSLAIGIGATSAIFSLVNAVVLRSLPIAEPHQLYIAQVPWRGTDMRSRFSYPLVEAAREELVGRAELCAQSNIQAMQVATSGAGGTREAETGQVQLVSGGCFGMLRQRAQIGRLLGPADNRTLGQHPVTVISDGYWTRRFGRASTVLESELVINGSPVAIVGVTAPDFFGTDVSTRTPDVWAPIMMQVALRFAGNASTSNGDAQKPWPPQREVSWLSVMMRLDPADVPAIAEAMNLTAQRQFALQAGFQEYAELRERLKATRVVLTPGARGFSRMRDAMATPLIVLLAMVSLLLLIACANIASLLLARASHRQREIAIRLSIGAGRGRLVRQLLTESLLLAVAGGLVGLLVAHWGSTALLTFVNRGAPVSGIDVSPDWRVIAVTFAISLATALLFGLLPALRSTQVRLAETLKAHARSVIGSTGPGRRAPLGKLLIAGQMAFSLLLLVMAALFARSLQELVHVDVGFDRARLLVAQIDARAAGFTPADLPALYRRIIERVAAVPGVKSASMSGNGLFTGSRSSSSIEVEGYVRGRDEQMTANKEWATDEYFRTVGLAIRDGRGFGPQDAAEGRISVINETMARKYFKNQSPIGRRWNYGSTFGPDAFEIIGVVEDARYNDVKADPINMIYLPVAETGRFLESIEIRTDGNPASLAPAIRAVLRQAEPRLPIIAIDTLEQRVTQSMGLERLLTWLTLAFGGVALGLACLGLYGTISYAVMRRTQELGVRLALGAGRPAVQWLILREALTLVLGGLLVGLPTAVLAAHAVGKLLYGTAATDLLAYGAAIAALVAIATLAAYLPARRASRLDPLVALRAE